MRTIKKALYGLADFVREILLVVTLWLPEFQGNDQKRRIPVIASLTTYPPRIGSAWIAIETLLRQTVRPRKLLLVLNEEEFPEKVLPRKIRSQARRGLEILWAKKNGRSYDKLIPVRQEFPEDIIVTFDDDKFFPPSLLEELFQASLGNRDAVIGSRGWVIRESQLAINYGAGWERAAPGAHGQHLLTPGGNGCLYPPKAMDKAVDHLPTALEVCPTADDIWFWCAIQKNGSRIVCLGHPPHRPVAALKSTEALSDKNATANNRQFQNALDYWEIRDTVSDRVRGEQGHG